MRAVSSGRQRWRPRRGGPGVRRHVLPLALTLRAPSPQHHSTEASADNPTLPQAMLAHLHDAVLPARHQQPPVLAPRRAIGLVLETSNRAPHAARLAVVNDHLRVICAGRGATATGRQVSRVLRAPCAQAPRARLARALRAQRPGAGRRRMRRRADAGGARASAAGAHPRGCRDGIVVWLLRAEVDVRHSADLRGRGVGGGAADAPRAAAAAAGAPRRQRPRDADPHKQAQSGAAWLIQQTNRLYTPA